MSLFGFSRLFTANARKRRSSGRSRATGGPRKRRDISHKRTCPRRLQFDPLESRELLTVSPADLSDMLASQQLDLYNAAFPEPNLRADYPARSHFTDAARALAGDNDGDFVVVWTRNDPVVNPRMVIRFDNPNVDPLIGTFKLKIPVNTGTDQLQLQISDLITFNSSALSNVAEAIQAELIKAGYNQASVSVKSLANPYSFNVEFGRNAGVLDQVRLIEKHFEVELIALDVRRPIVQVDHIPIIDGNTGLPKSDLNIYARYLTDEVQRIFLPAGVLDNNNPAPFTNGRFSLLWGGNEVQKISITATNQPFAFTQQNIQGTITLGFDVNENGLIDNTEKTTVVFNENDFGAADPSLRPQTIIQTQLRGLGGALTDCIVEALDPHTYIVYFGNAAQGKNQPQIVVDSQFYTAGFFPAATVSTVREPRTISNIVVASNANTPSLDPWAAAQATAAQIEQAFAQQTGQDYLIAPVTVQAPQNYAYPVPAPYSAPSRVRKPISVSVTPVDLTAQGYPLGTVFDITFTGAYAKQDIPLMVITDVRADDGADLRPQLPPVPVKTMKQSSAEFRVNPPDPVNPVTGEPEPLDQRNPAIAMDADGDFVITWESDVPDSVNFGSVSDIFARRFSPMGIVDDPSSVRGFVTQGVRSWVNDVQVLTFDPNLAGPLVGTFKIQIPNWLTGELVTSDPIPFDSRTLGKVVTDIQANLVMAGYSGARVRQISGVDPYQFEITFGGRQAGLDVPQIAIVDDTWSSPIGVQVTKSVVDRSDSTFRVNTTTTNRQVTPAIGMDAEGNFVIAWANVAQDLSYFNRIAFQRFNRDGDPVGSETLAPTQGQDVTAVYLNPAVALSPDGHFALAWEWTTDPEFFHGGPYTTLISALIYDQTNTPGNFLGVGGGNSRNVSLAFDPANNLAVAWQVWAADKFSAVVNFDTQAQVFRVDGSTLRAPFRIN